jgi:hypothetical protein
MGESALVSVTGDAGGGHRRAILDRHLAAGHVGREPRGPVVWPAGGTAAALASRLEERHPARCHVVHRAAQRYLTRVEV